MSDTDRPGHQAAVTHLAGTMRAQHVRVLELTRRVLWAAPSPSGELLRRPAVRTPAITHGAAEIWLRASWEPTAGSTIADLTGAAAVVTTSVTATVPGTSVPPRVNPVEVDAWAAALYPQCWAPAQLRLPLRLFECTREYVTFLAADGTPLCLPEPVRRRLPAWPT